MSSTAAPVSSLVRRPAVRRLGGQVIRRISRTERDEVIDIWSLWVRARLRALRNRGLARGAAVMWPQPGKAWMIALDTPMPGRHQILIYMTATAVSAGTERAHFNRLPHANASFPVFPGYSGAGRVIAIGQGVTRFRVGDVVAAQCRHGSMALVNEDHAFRVPEGVSEEQAAFVQLGIIALQAWRSARIGGPDPVVIFGHGVIGQLLVQIAAAAGVHPIISIARTGRRVSDALKRCATRVIADGDLAGRAPEDGVAAVTFEATGDPNILRPAIQWTREGGRVVLAGSPRGATESLDVGSLAERGITIAGAHISSLSSESEARANAAEDARIFFGLLARRELDLSSLVSTRINPLEAESFYRRLSRQDDGTIGAVMRWDLLPNQRRFRRVSFLLSPDLSLIRGATFQRLPQPLHWPGGAAEASP